VPQSGWSKQNNYSQLEGDTDSITKWTVTKLAPRGRCNSPAVLRMAYWSEAHQRGVAELEGLAEVQGAGEGGADDGWEQGGAQAAWNDGASQPCISMLVRCQGYIW
jgi:hypothetical protein